MYQPVYTGYVHTHAHVYMYHSLQAFTLVQPTSATPWISPSSYTSTLWGPLQGGCGGGRGRGRERVVGERGGGRG